MTENTADLRNVVEGDTVTIETTEGHTFEAECVSYEKQHADPRSGEVRETNVWQFEGDRNVAVSFTDGLKSSPDDPEFETRDNESPHSCASQSCSAQFPVHNEVWDSDEEESIGYIESLTIAGAKV